MERGKGEREMSSAAHKKPHVICIPFPAQGHITPMLALAKLLHSSGFHITFVNTECNHRRLLRSCGQHVAAFNRYVRYFLDLSAGDNQREIQWKEERGEGEMSSAAYQKPHVVCIPFPAQGHITPMLALTKLLHSSGFHITFVHTEYNHRRLLRSRGQTGLAEFPDFQFATIPDGLLSSDEDVTQDILSLGLSLGTTGLPHLRDLLDRLNKSGSGVPSVTCVIADSAMSFALDAAEYIAVPCALLWTSGSCSFMGCLQYRYLISRGLVPLKDLNQLSNGFLDTPVSVPGMNNMRLRDFPTLIRTTDLNDPMLNLVINTMDRQSKATAIVINTFDELEHAVLDSLKSTMTPPIYTIGPLQLLVDQIVTGSPLVSLSPNLWVEEPRCLEWLEGKKARSVVYVSFGSLAVMTREQLVEFAWGLANSKYDFLWITRPDLVQNNSSHEMLPQEFLEEVKERGFLASWCPQMAVLRHKAIGLFLTHCGWNSTLESISNGVPMLSWPVVADQQTNCRYVCAEWQIGMEIDNDVKREEVEKLIREVMEGGEGKKMKERGKEWKESAIRATLPGGTSFVHFQKLLQEVLSKNQ